MPKKNSRKTKIAVKPKSKKSESYYSSSNNDSSSEASLVSPILPKRTCSPMKWPKHYRDSSNISCKQQLKSGYNRAEDGSVYPSAGTCTRK